MTNPFVSHDELLAMADHHRPATGWHLAAVCASLPGFEDLTDDVCSECPVRLDCLADVLTVERKLPLVQVLLQRGVPASARLLHLKESHDRT